MTSRPAAPTSRRRLGAAAAALVAALGLSACQVASPTTTAYPYDPADGVSLELGDVEVLDVLLVSTGQGEVGVVAGYAVNSASEPAVLEIALETEEGARLALSPPVDVPANGAVRIDGYDPVTGEFTDPVVVPEVPVGAGQMLTVRVSDGEDTVSSLVPVLLPAPPYSVYDEVLGTEG